MEQQLAWVAGRLGDEDMILPGQSDTKAYYGRLMRAWDYSRRAVEAAMRAESRESAALWRAAAGLREAEFGNPAAGRQNADSALSLSSGPDVKLLAALTLARAGDTANARRLVEQLERTPSTNTMLKIYCLPTIDAAIEISNALAGDAGKARAAYQDFSILWKDADPDPDIPILGEAKAEYVRLQ